MRRATTVCIFLTVLFCCVAARAEHTRFWEQSSFDEFEKGTHHGVALRSDGVLLPAREFKTFADANLAYVWALAVDSHGRLYAAGGSDAKVVRLDSAGKATAVFESTELEAQALAIDKNDNLYVGTSPDGKIYKVTSNGQRSVFFDPKSKYIWALAFGPRGTLFVATGDQGQVYAVAPDGKGQLFYKSDETHARSLAFDGEGNLLIGTDPSGLIIRVPIRSGSAAIPQAGSAFVVYETDKKEVTSLLTDHAGNIYAASVGNKSGRPARPVPLANLAAQNQLAQALAAEERQQGATGAAAQQNLPRVPAPAIFPPFPGTAGGSEVYRIAPDGSPESLWSSPQDVVYSLALSPEGHLLLGTGNHGEVIELGENRLYSSLASTDASQVTALIPGPGHAIYVATANPGKVFTLGPGFAAEGTFESQPFDAKIYSRWGRLTWWGLDSSARSKVEFYVRSGNTSDPDNYWSAWSGPYSDPSGQTVTCPAARFVQWKAVFHSVEPGQPSLSWVRLAYLRKNVAPQIDGMVIEEPGVRAQNFSIPEGAAQNSGTVALRMPQSGAEENVFANYSAELKQEQAHHFNAPLQGRREKGYRTVVWSASDANDDELTATLYFRGQDEKDWKLLKDNIRENFYSWDTSTMPDGAYYLKLVVSDASSNPAGQALTAETTSDRFLVDNTPPSVENLRAQQENGAWHIQFTAHDSASAIARAAYSLDAGRWQMITPRGELTDAPTEDYDIALGGLKPGEHTIAVRVFDEFENSAAGKTTFTVEGSATQAARHK